MDRQRKRKGRVCSCVCVCTSCCLCVSPQIICILNDHQFNHRWFALAPAVYLCTLCYFTTWVNVNGTVSSQFISHAVTYSVKNSREIKIPGTSLIIDWITQIIFLFLIKTSGDVQIHWQSILDTEKKIALCKNALFNKDLSLWLKPCDSVSHLNQFY